MLCYDSMNACVRSKLIHTKPGTCSPHDSNRCRIGIVWQTGGKRVQRLAGAEVQWGSSQEGAARVKS